MITGSGNGNSDNRKQKVSSIRYQQSTRLSTDAVVSYLSEVN